MNDNEIYSDKVTKGSRTYFFDIKKSEKGDLYLKISESKKTQSGYEHHRLMVFDEDLKDFVEALKKLLTKFKELKEPKNSKTYSVEKIRETHQKAYLPWTAEDDNKLELLFCEGKKVKELAELFGRNVGAINSRIKKLELKDKYGK
jgi:DNA-directed RNA polymerase specialized sigma24 family protein